MPIVSRFFKYVEIRTKLASVLPFALALLYSQYTYGQVIWLNTAVFFIAMILFDMATTALNNYMDTKVNDAPLPFDLTKAKVIFLMLLALATAAGLVLVALTNLIVLAVGALCFLIGIIYTFGPVQISHLPLGEAFSGFFMGFLIPFLTVFINAPAPSLASYAVQGEILMLSINMMGVLKLLLFTVPAICGIANIMLANNICDLEYDRSINRHTLVHYIGVRHALGLFAALYAISYAAVVAMALTGVLPLYALAVCLTAVPVGINLKKFFKKQVKRETFATSVQNFTLLMASLIVVVLLAILI